MVKEDWNAAMSSEVFREYTKNELVKEAYATQPEPVKEEQVMDDFQAFEQKIRETPHLKAAFKQLQTKFANDLAYRNRVNPKFVEGVLLLNLDSEE
ncbi:MAG TPA: hypothetical protein VM577_14150 [Anaerovoracaceae bacterium]|nr:hypothetical protein [Anaerovoracaceae bacterium]